VSAWRIDPSWPKQKPPTKWAGCPEVKVDSKDQVWVTTRRYPAVEIYDINGNFIRAWDSPKLFNDDHSTIYLNPKQAPNLHYMRFDSAGNLWISDTARHTVRKCDPNGNVLLTLGVPDEPGADNAHFNRPAGVDVGPAGVFVADGYGNRRVVHYSLDGKFIKTWGKQGIAPGEFILPHDVAHDSKGRLYVADRMNERIQIFDYDGKLLDIWRDLIMPWAIHVTAKDEIWVAGSIAHDRANVRRSADDLTSQVIARFDTTGRIHQMQAFYVGVQGQARYATGNREMVIPSSDRPGDMNTLHGMAFDSKNNLYLATTFGMQLVQKFVPVQDTTTTNAKGEPL
jgi:streptogramin lyase